MNEAKKLQDDLGVNAVVKLKYPARLPTGEHSAADMAWWFGWSVQDVYDLDLEEFEDWMNEITRQIKAGYRKGM